MNYRYLRLIYSLLLPVLCLTSCSGDDSVFPGNTPEDPEKCYLSIRLTMDTPDSRANPNGGQDGDGREPGHGNENRIYDLNLFFFKSGTGINDDGNTPILYTLYIGDLNIDLDLDKGGYYYELLEQVDFRIEDGLCFITAANLGRPVTELNTLAQVRDFIVDKAWQNAALPEDCDRFVMSTASDGNSYNRIIVNASSHNGTRTNPFRAQTSLERTAARIDLMITAGQATRATEAEGIPYSVTDPDNGAEIATVHLLGILPVNDRQQNSFLLKRVTLTATHDYDCFNHINFCSPETSGSDNLATNYVVEPNTVAKTGTVSDDRLTEWYGDTRSGNISAASFASARPLKAFMGEGAVRELTDVPGFDKTFTLAYTHENTQHVKQHDIRFITGLALKAVYRPAKVYRYVEASGVRSLVEDNGYAYGKDFWRYTPSQGEMLESQSLYFSSEEDAGYYAEQNPDDLAEIEKFTGGVCYYNVWLRHSNDDKSDPHMTCPMEFGIVRNNIYRAGFRFSGPGTPDVNLKKPSEIESIIYVRKWLFRKHSEIIM